MRASLRQFLVDYGQFRRLRFGVTESIDLAMTRVRVARAGLPLTDREVKNSVAAMATARQAVSGAAPKTAAGTDVTNKASPSGPAGALP